MIAIAFVMKWIMIMLCAVALSGNAKAELYGYVDEQGQAHLANHPVGERYQLFQGGAPLPTDSAEIKAMEGRTDPHDANYITPAEEKAQARQSDRDQAKKRLAAYVGKYFWIVPNTKSFQRAEFYKEITYESGGDFVKEEGLFHPLRISRFSVIDYAVDFSGMNENYLKIRFEDGMEGFLKLTENSPKFYHGGARYDFEEYIYSENPTIVDKRQAKQRAAAKAVAQAAAKERASRGGVRIGMTKSEALRSSWGRPHEINRTTTAGGVHEQWVYGGRNYLYFENGILTAIQN